MDNNSIKKPSGGQFKNFKLTENQALWDKYHEFKLAEAQQSTKQNKTDPKLVIAQYKPGILALEQLTEKSFAEVTAEDLIQLDIIRQGKNMLHVRGFLITVISEGWMNPYNKELVVYLIPQEYRNLAKILFE